MIFSTKLLKMDCFKSTFCICQLMAFHPKNFKFHLSNIVDRIHFFWSELIGLHRFYHVPHCKNTHGKV